MSWHPGGPVGNPHAGEGYSGRNRRSAKGGPSGVQRSYASQLKESDSLFTTYEHLQGLPRGDSALTMLRKVASIVKPIMRKRGWRVQVLAEFLPPENNLLGLNINKGYKICIRLRYHNNPDLFLPLEEVVDTMLHELSHNVWGDHDSNFHKLWDELRDEHEALLRKGYTGEGFMSEGQRLGGSGNHSRPVPLHEMRQRARASAEKRKAQGTLAQGSGQRLGGTPLHLQGRDVRNVIADQVTRRNVINKGCGSGRSDANQLSQQAAQNSFTSKAEEDDANNRAIARALEELMEEEEAQKLNGTFKGSSSGGLEWSPEHGLYNAGMEMPKTSSNRPDQPDEEEQMKWALQESMASTSSKRPASASSPLRDATRPAKAPSSGASTIKHEMIDRDSVKSESEPLIDLTSIPEDTSDDQWTCEVCTLVNPIQFLACDACGIERPQSARSKSKARDQARAKSPQVKVESKGVRRKEAPLPKQPETMGWNCYNCGAFMEHKWWTCSACGVMKASS